MFTQSPSKHEARWMGAQIILTLERVQGQQVSGVVTTWNSNTRISFSTRIFPCELLRLWKCSWPNKESNRISHTVVSTHPPPQTRCSAWCDHPVTSNTNRQGLLLVKDSRGVFFVCLMIFRVIQFPTVGIGTCQWAQTAHTAAWALLDSAFRSRMHLAMLSFCCKRQETAFRGHFNKQNRHSSAF